jgi:F0F1-type ATP synthase membrane subunit b/b'
MNVFFIVSIICLALCFIMFLYLKWYIKKRASASGLEEHRTEIAKLIADIDSVTDRNLQLVEDSISKLKILLEETGKRIEDYKNAIEIKPAGDTLYTNLGRGIRAALLNPGEQTLSQLQAEHSRQMSTVNQNSDETSIKSERKKNTQTAKVSEGQVSEKPVSEKSVSQKPASKKQIRSDIDILVNEGLSPEEIASRLDISVAQVNLAMKLHRTKRK